MSKLILLTIFVVLTEFMASSCLITNCPRGGKRSKLELSDTHLKTCPSCGPAQSGQCFGPNICCGPFGCLIGTPETARCQREMHEACLTGSTPCRKNTGRCAFDGVCCTQVSCYMDKSCSSDDKLKPFVDNALDLYSFLNYQSELNGDK